MANKGLPLPDFYDPKAVGTVFQGREFLMVEKGFDFREKFNIAPASKDKVKVAYFSIDRQIGFCIPPDVVGIPALHWLFVPGAVEDSQRECEFIYRNLDKITSLNFSMDTHKMFQIFHPMFWVDTQTGRPPAPFTVVTLDQIREGRYQAIVAPLEAQAYCEQLEKTGKFQLMIWPIHCELGSIGHALVPAAYEAAMFHAVVRQVQTHFELKGTHPLTENYSVLSPEVKSITVGNRVITVGAFNAKFFQLLMNNDAVLIGGEASSHCVQETTADLKREIEQTEPELMKKVWIMEDLMSPVPAVTDGKGNVLVDFPQIALQALEEFKNAGMNVIKSTDPWPF